ncbi:NAD(P)(+)--arginine ADP-ribosyltransferase 2-like [Melanotaenia boesemani]|uniref:NAD(P)(+)--arginine ADP-ribosyltransferase 2-like n=1 Tax=Melanotaenia boesemani TaxID=1250792 RepID=UPI001C0522B3|nr:NAD(P)(+)--arginine ADP-ribosyltransferase 2-like [Melanotaenia boesemani]
MKNMMIFTLLCLTLCWMLSVDSMRIPLDMADKSVDDMYDGCNDTASLDQRKEQYSKELTSGKKYAQAWKIAETCANKTFKNRSREDMNLTKDHMQAICVYTAKYVYSQFNTAVRKQRKRYTKSFRYHILHFLLTTAIRILNPNHRCHITYRRTDAAFTGKLNQTIRFGSFASSSYKMDLKKFGNETCFKIKTCYGGYLKNYSYYNDEQEVLIPPFEMFTIKNIARSPRCIEGLKDCKTVYVLESAGYKSNLNCELSFVQKQSVRATEILQDKQKQLALPIHKLIQDVSTRWNSTENMLERVLEQQPAISAALMPRDLKRGEEVNTLKVKDFCNIENIVNLMAPVKPVTTSMCEDKRPTLNGSPCQSEALKEL